MAAGGNPATHRRAGASTLASVGLLIARLTAMLSSVDRGERDRALAAVLPADVLRGDGELLAELGAAFAARVVAHIEAAGAARTGIG